MAKKTNTELPKEENIVLEVNIKDLTIKEVQTLMNQIADELANELPTEAKKSKLAYFYELKKVRNEKLAEVAN